MPSGSNLVQRQVDSASATRFDGLVSVRAERQTVQPAVARTGSSRGAEEDDLGEALPAGKLSEPHSDLVVVLGPAPDSNMSSFELLVDGRIAVHVTGPVRTITLPAAKLKQGAHATWRLEYAGQHLSNAFDVTAPEQLAALKTELGNETTASDAKVAKLRLASGLIAAGYSWDARDLIREAIAP